MSDSKLNVPSIVIEDPYKNLWGGRKLNNDCIKCEMGICIMQDWEREEDRIEKEIEESFKNWKRVKTSFVREDTKEEIEQHNKWVESVNGQRYLECDKCCYYTELDNCTNCKAYGPESGH